jgi:hypothetical protein
MIWQDIPEWDRYLVSEYGDIKSKDMTVGAKGGATAIRKGRKLALVMKNNGYVSVTLTNGIFRPQIGVHRLVARAFIGECPIGLHVLHWDGNKANNHYTNLRYGTAADNHDDERRMNKEGRILTKDDVIEIRSRKKTASELAKFYGVSIHTIHGVWCKRTWKHIL